MQNMIISTGNAFIVLWIILVIAIICMVIIGIIIDGFTKCVTRLLHVPRPLSRESMVDGGPPEPEESSAYHEAAHAVAALALGIGFDHVSVVDDRNTLGRIVLDQGWPHRRPGFDPSSLLDRRLAEDWILVALAGEFASADQIGINPDWSTHGASSDFAAARAVVERLFVHPRESDAFVKEMCGRAQLFVRDPLRRRQITAVAAQLARLRLLDRGQVAQIMDDVAVGETAGTN